MTRVADFYERELRKRISILSKAIEPIMLIVMGVVVGLIVVSLILPFSSCLVLFMKLNEEKDAFYTANTLKKFN